jgi:hypothetical protein
MRRRLALVLAIGTLLLVAMLVAGLAAPGGAAAAGMRPVVSSVSPATGPQTGATTVAITGQNFKLNGKNAVKAVTFGGKPATHIRVKSATLVKVMAPAGVGTVHIRVTTKNGKSRRWSADKYIYIAPATNMILKAGTDQTVSSGTAVPVAPSVLVTDARGNSVTGVHVTFQVTSGGGSITGADAVSDASGIATVGSWKVGSAPGENWLTATSAGLTGSPIMFFAKGDAGILTVTQAGVPVRSYSLAELQSLTPFVGFAGLAKTPAWGPDAVTGVKVTDIVADALGAQLAVTQSVKVAEVDATPYSATMTRDQLVNLTGFTYIDATTRATIVPTGTLAAILVYSDPAGKIMPASAGPLRFMVADSINENMAYGKTSTSVSKVNTLDVIPTP